MRATTIAAAPGNSRAVIVDVVKATQRAAESRMAVFLRVIKAPTFLALARGRDIRPDRAQDAPNVDMGVNYCQVKGNACAPSTLASMKLS